VFRWCSYCQHLIGEAPPFDQFLVTHGMCDSCSKTMASYSPGPVELRARDVFTALESAGRSGDFERCAKEIDEALASGMPPSEVIVGVLHPALGRIGELWESGEISVADEHRFTNFALQLLDRLHLAGPPQDRPLVLLATFDENCHQIGPRMLQHFAWEHGYACKLLPVGTSRPVLMAAIHRDRPVLVGLSVSLAETIPAALAFARKLLAMLPTGTALVLGGQAFRRRDTANVPEDLEVLCTLDDFVARLESLGQNPGLPPRGGLPGNASSGEPQ
jgi:methanogenic corrinoid protein MtbC1